MALNLQRWIRYAQAKVSDVVRSSEEDLARREAARELEQADRPWLGDDAEAPSLETTRARIAWEAEQSRPDGSSADGARDDAPPAADRTDGMDDADDAAAAGADTGATASDAGSAVDLERFGTGAAEAAQARIELDQRAAESAARLEAIRRELDLDDAPDRDVP